MSQQVFKAISFQRVIMWSESCIMGSVVCVLTSVCLIELNCSISCCCSCCFSFCLMSLWQRETPVTVNHAVRTWTHINSKALHSHHVNMKLYILLIITQITLNWKYFNVHYTDTRIQSNLYILITGSKHLRPEPSVFNNFNTFNLRGI